MHLVFRFVLLSFLASLSVPAIAQDFPYQSYSAREPFSGKIRLPDFSGRDAKFRDYRTRITAKAKQGPDFAQSLAIVVIGCGTGCRFAYAIDLRSGQVFNFPRGGEDHMYLDLGYRRDSRLIVARWVGDGQQSYGPDRACTLESFEWTGRGFNLVSEQKASGERACEGEMR